MPLFLYSSDPRTPPQMPRDYAIKDYRATRIVPRPPPCIACMGRLIFWALIALAGVEIWRMGLS